MIITRSKGGTAERQVDIGAHNVPDLWHIYERLSAGEDVRGLLMPVYQYTGSNPEELREQPNGFTEGTHQRATVAEAVLDCWHLCHDLIKHIEYLEELNPTAFGFTTEDVIGRAHDNADTDEGDEPTMIPTQEEAKAILEIMLKDCDFNAGVSWESVDQATAEYYRREEEKQKHQPDPPRVIS